MDLLAGGDASLTGAYACCEQLARRHYENFPVASRLLPRSMRPHVAAVYAFARTADDFADEDERPAVERQRLLDAWRDRLHAAASLSPPPGYLATAADRDEHDALFLALSHTIRQFHLPVGLFDDLLSAFRQDTEKARYETFDELVDYCRRSANPVGRLVLRIARYDDRRLDTASDSVCTALQLANFWQDLAIDWRRGRLYVPLAELRAAGARSEDLDAGRLTDAWREVLSALVARTRALFMEGRAVADGVRGRLCLELRLTWLGGMRILERLERERFDVFRHRPALGARDVPLLLWRAARWRVQSPPRAASRADRGEAPASPLPSSPSSPSSPVADVSIGHAQAEEPTPSGRSGR